MTGLPIGGAPGVGLPGSRDRSVGGSAPSSGSPRLIAHRGSSRRAPENTIASIRAALEDGADGVEIDVRQTLDGYPVLCHDRTPARTTSTEPERPDLEGLRQRPVERSRLADLQLLDAGAWFGAGFGSGLGAEPGSGLGLGFRGERLPTLEAALRALRPEVLLHAELKSGPETTASVLEVLLASNHARVRLIAFDLEVLKRLRELDPSFRIRSDWLLPPDHRPTCDEILRARDRFRFDGLGLGISPVPGLADAAQDLPAPTWVARLRDEGLSLHAWTVDDPEQAQRLIDLGLETLTTNRPAELRSELRREGLDGPSRTDLAGLDI